MKSESETGKERLRLVLNERTGQFRLPREWTRNRIANLDQSLISSHRKIWERIREDYYFPYSIPVEDTELLRSRPPLDLEDENSRSLVYSGVLHSVPSLRTFSQVRDARRLLVPYVLVPGEADPVPLTPSQSYLIEKSGTARVRRFWLIEDSVPPSVSALYHSVLEAPDILERLELLKSAETRGLEDFANPLEFGPALHVQIAYTLRRGLEVHGRVELVYARSRAELLPAALEELQPWKICRPIYDASSVLAHFPLHTDENPSLFARSGYELSEEGYLVHRDAEAEKLKSDVSFPFAIDANGRFQLNPLQLFDFFNMHLEEFLRNGALVSFDRELLQILKVAPRAQFQLIEGSGIDWFEGKIEIDGFSETEIRRILEAYRKGKNFARAEDGNWIAFHESDLDSLLVSIADLGLKVSADGRIEGLRAGHWMALQSELGQQFQLSHRLKRILSQNSISLKKGPGRGFRGSLRAYQKKGLEFLQLLYSHGVGGVLADEMGLGKTIQALAFINQLCEKSRATVLVVCPVAAISVWSEAIQEHCPHIPVQIWHGNRNKLNPARSGLVITSFALLHMDLDRFLAGTYDAVVIDEAQNLRNSRSKAATAARLLKARSVFCLTGTPMENHLEDFRSIMDLAVPGLLGTSHAFRRTYSPSEPASLTRLARRAAPFLLRRTKAQVLSELPEKTEINRVIPMQKKQAALYETLREEALEELSIAGNEYLVQMLPHLMRLRRVACHPALGQANANPLHSGKFQYLRELLDQFQKSESASLVFSQFTDALDIAESLLQSMQLKYVRLDGSTPQKLRSKNVAAFQSGQADVFLISLRAGGQAITLHRADRVVLLDPWWNPAVESQASDRAHRIGQKNPVFVYRLIAERSIEERVRELQSRKKELFHSLLSGISPEHSNPRLDRSDLMELLAEIP